MAPSESFLHPATAATAEEPAAISPEQLEALGEARLRCRRITRAAGVATFSGWTMGCFAVITLISGVFSLRALLLGIGLCVVTFVELRGAKALRRFDLGAPLRLALNQSGLALIVTIYAAWGIAHALMAPGPYDDYLSGGGEMAEMLAPIDRLTRVVTVGVYAAVICGSIVAQGCTALYYLTRRRHIADFLERTPGWIAETFRVAA